MVEPLGWAAFGSVAGWSVADLVLTHISAGTPRGRSLRRVAYVLVLAGFPALAAGFGGAVAAATVLAGAALGAWLRRGLAVRARES